jgi:hypothetical protein
MSGEFVQARNVPRAKRLLAVLAAIAVYGLTAQQWADDWGIAHIANGSELLHYCAGRGSQQAACIGYVVGISDAMISGQIIGKDARIQACIPREVRGQR